MKAIITAIVVVGVITIASIKSPERVTYNAPEQEQEVEVNNEPEYPSEWLEEAKRASEDVLRRKSLEAESNRLEGEIKALKEQKDAIDKELGTY